MGFLDDMKDKAEDLVEDHGDKIDSGIDKAADLVDDKTGHKHSDKIDSAALKAKSAIDELEKKDDDA